MIESSVFDQLAADYDAAFSARLPAQWLRQRVRERVTQWVPEEGHILDVGCGTADDAIWFALQGHSVIATDLSEAMLEKARRKIEDLPGEIRTRISLNSFDAASRDVRLPNEQFDLVTSNFGALNCVADLAPFFENLQDHISPDGAVALTLMGPFCLWETLGFALRRNLQKARRRWNGKSVFTRGDVSQNIWYHSSSDIARMAGPHFGVVDLCGIGVFVPPTEFFPVCEKRPWFFRALASIESRVGSWWPFNRIGDHYLIILRPVSS